MKDFIASWLGPTLLLGMSCMAFVTTVFLSVQCETTEQQQRLDAFKACVAANRPPAECRMATSRGRNE